MADFSQPLPQAGGGSAGAADAAPSTSISCSKLLDKQTWITGFGKVKVLSRSFFNPGEFSKPASQADWLERVSVNAGHFKLLYALIFLPILVHTMLGSMWLRIGSGAMVLLWGYALLRPEPIKACGLELRDREKLYVLVPLSLLIGLMTGMINALLYATVLFACVTMPHMSFHNPARFDALDALELQAMNAEGQ